MATLPIVVGQDTPILRAKTKKVQTVTKEILKLLKDMEETTVAAQGAGIAAPQVGRFERLCIAAIGGKLTPLINPDITWRSEDMASAEEGCLSLPDVWIHVSRPTGIILRYETPEGKKRELKLSSLDARIVQHEVDHLEGILITDHRKQTVL